ncbi:MAG: hypothetical protein RLZZ91_1248 [Bacteroidota bacterium]|jgi:hypothetical protein
MRLKRNTNFYMQLICCLFGGTALFELRCLNYVAGTMLLELRCLNYVVNLPLSYVFLTSLIFCKGPRIALCPRNAVATE